MRGVSKHASHTWGNHVGRVRTAILFQAPNLFLFLLLESVDHVQREDMHL